jgi:hypothetical protein
VTQAGTTVVKKFTVIVNQDCFSYNAYRFIRRNQYNTADASKATLVLDAPLKDFIYVAGSFNDWKPTSAYSMKKDPTSGKFWWN